MPLGLLASVLSFGGIEVGPVAPPQAKVKVQTALSIEVIDLLPCSQTLFVVLAGLLELLVAVGFAAQGKLHAAFKNRSQLNAAALNILQRNIDFGVLG